MKNKIRVERAKRRMTQKELAKEVKASRQTIHQIESNKTDPKIGIAMRIARFFGLNVEDIFQDDE